MPELPEVETIRNGLAKFLPGLKIASVRFDWPKGFPNSKNDVEAFLIGTSIKKVSRRGKALIIDLSSNYSLVIHLKMTGQLVFIGQKPEVEKLDPVVDELKVRFGGGHPTDSLINRLPDKSTRVTFVFSNGAKLFFNDQRKFGWVKLLPTSEVKHLDFFKKLGPEPLSHDFTEKLFDERLARRKNTSVKAAILDQTVLAGVGNIYADESLWLAKIHPATPVKNLVKVQIKMLHDSIIEVLELAIKNGGSTDRNYVNAEGERGNYLSYAHVFRREGQACPRCGETIIKIRVAGRGTHICPREQKLKI